MDMYKQLMHQAQEKAKEARALIEANKADDGSLSTEIMAQIQGLLDEADELRSKAHDAKQLVLLEKRSSDLASFFSESLGRRTRPDPSEADPQAPLPASETKDDYPLTTVEVAHNLRYGEMPRQVKMLIHDLYGDTYAEKRIALERAFTKYVRYGEKPLTTDEYNILRSEPILTPDQVLAAVKSGVPFSEVKETLVEASDTLGGLTPAEYGAAGLLGIMA